MKKKIFIASLSTILIILVVIGYLIYCYLTPNWKSTGVGFPVGAPMHASEGDGHKVYTPADRYIQILHVPSPTSKHNLPIPEKYKVQSREMYYLNKEIVEEMNTFIAPTYIKVDFKIVGDDTIATYHGNATTKDGKAIEYSRDVVFEGIIIDFVQSYGDVPIE